MRVSRSGFTLLELMVTATVIAVLAAGGFAVYKAMRMRAGTLVATGHVRALVHANLGYAMDHDGAFCPAQDRRNLVRWHGGRRAAKEPFDPAQGFLAPYLGKNDTVQRCPLLGRVLTGRESFENNAGGYGYNAIYIGGQPGHPWTQARMLDVETAGRVVMFATTALSRKKGIQEYPYTEPFFWPSADGSNGGALQPTTHFRAGGRAVVGWCDGHVTLEGNPNFRGPNFYGGNNERDETGWFGPAEENGHWNPASPAARGITARH
jgi:prepilin-type N-terminal cleavage/methylation domain-containing protein/prepilin-type processing-associated H-X9-DG protein